MGRRKIEIKFIEDRSARQATFSRRQAGLFKKADTLAKLCDVEIAILVNSPTDVPHVYGSPSFDDVVKRIQDPSASYILKSQAKLDELMKELKQTEEYEEMLRKRKEENIEKFNMKKLIDLNFGDLVAFKGKLEAVQADFKKKHVEMEPMSSALVLSKNKKKNKKKEKIGNELVSSGQISDLSERKIYDLRPRNPVNYVESP